MTSGRLERRIFPRLPGTALRWLATARLRPGRPVQLVNVSNGGALIELSGRLLPGSQVVLQFVGPGTTMAVGARVVRCGVTAIDAEAGVRYRGAVAFEEHLDLADPWVADTHTR